MLSQNKIKYIQSLHAKKFRQKYNIFIAEGDKIACEIIESKKIVVENIFATRAWIEKNTDILLPFTSQLIEIKEDELKKISCLSTPNQVLVTAAPIDVAIEENIVNNDFSLYLDGIQDPGNMGTILRIADWFGIRYVFCSEQCVEVLHPKVVQSSMGAFLRIRTQIIDLEAITNKFPTLPVFGAFLEGKNIFSIENTKRGIIVIGNEGAGISAKNSALVSQKIAIPAHGVGAESLNAGVATGIICAVLRNGK